MRNYIIKNAIIVNEGRKMNGDVLIKDGRIDKIGTSMKHLMASLKLMPRACI